MPFPVQHITAEGTYIVHLAEEAVCKQVKYLDLKIPRIVTVLSSGCLLFMCLLLSSYKVIILMLPMLVYWLCTF